MVLRKFKILPIEKIGTISHYTEIVCMFMYSNQFVCFAKTLICNSKIWIRIHNMIVGRKAYILLSTVIDGKWSLASFYCSSDYWTSFKHMYFDNQRDEKERLTIRCYVWSSEKQIELPSSMEFMVIIWHPYPRIFRWKVTLM